MAQLKEPTTYQEQLDILQKRNVIIDNSARCVAVLECQPGDILIYNAQEVAE